MEDHILIFKCCHNFELPMMLTVALFLDAVPFFSHLHKVRRLATETGYVDSALSLAILHWVVDGMDGVGSV